MNKKFFNGRRKRSKKNRRKTRKKRGGMTLEEIKERIKELEKEMQEMWWEQKIINAQQEF